MMFNAKHQALLLQGNLQLRTEQIPLTDCYVLEERDVNNINPPHTLRFLVQVPRRSIGYGIVFVKPESPCTGIHCYTVSKQGGSSEQG